MLNSRLPPELILYICSFIPPVPTPCYDRKVLSNGDYYRQSVLRSVSQSCRWLNSALEPVLYESVEITHQYILKYLHPPPLSAWRALFARYMLSQLDQLSRHAPLVRSITVELSSTDNLNVTYSCFAQTIHALPRLLTLQIIAMPPKAHRELCSAFSPYRYRTVRTLIIPLYAIGIAYCFPEVTTVVILCEEGCRGSHKPGGFSPPAALWNMFNSTKIERFELPPCLDASNEVERECPLNNFCNTPS
jgi:hypothetical protein